MTLPRPETVTCSTTDANARRCRRCERPIRPYSKSPPPADVAAWLDGCCSALCHQNQALDVVSLGGAWWQYRGVGKRAGGAR